MDILYIGSLKWLVEQVIEDRQGRKIGCIEEAAFKMGFIDQDQLKQLAQEAPSKDQVE